MESVREYVRIVIKRTERGVVGMKMEDALRPEFEEVVEEVVVVEAMKGGEVDV